MKSKLGVKISIGIVILFVLIGLLLPSILEPKIREKIQTALNGKKSKYRIEIEKVHFSLIRSELELETISIHEMPEQEGIRKLVGEITYVKLKGIRFIKALFTKNIVIREVVISGVNILGKIPFQENKNPPLLSPYNIKIGSLFLDQIRLEIGNTLASQNYSVKDGILKIYDLNVEKLDTISTKIIRQFDFDAVELFAVTADSMYTFTATGTNYSAKSAILVVDSFSIHPNYNEHEFTARHEFQSDRIEAGFRNIVAHNFSASDYLISKRLVSSYVEIAKMNLFAYRDQRKPFRHRIKPTFQEMIYKYPEALSIDSVGILDGNITYTEHAKLANEPGQIRFNKLYAKIIKLTNDTIYKTQKAFLELHANALLMGKGKLSVRLKSELFDSNNTFSMNGSLSEMEASDLNPILEKNAFIYATAGKIDHMNFNFTANNTRSTGKMILQYHDLNIAVKNKQTDDTTAIKEKFVSIIANLKLMDSNPLPGQNVREGIINKERDPERFLINYSFKSILSGMKSSLVKESKKQENKLK